MNKIDTVVIGAGHAGLAVSRLLTDADREHIVLDRGRVADRWRTERWDSLRLLTPNWMLRLPGQSYDGAEPDGFMGAGDFVQYLEHYAASFDAPVLPGRTVQELAPEALSGYRVVTDNGTWRARHVIIATGPHGVPHVPPGLTDVEVVTSNRYRNPGQVAAGGVLVIGASASGTQIADELNRSGRHVVLASGRHTRMPRTYRGMDIFWWLACTGRLARTIDDVRDPAAARREPSLQLTGRMALGEAAEVDLRALQSRGVRLVGRFAGMDGGRAQFRPDLHRNASTADGRMYRVLDSIDEYIARSGLTDEVLPAHRPHPLDLPASTLALDLSRAGISTVVVAAGYQPEYPWLRLPITRPDGSIRQHRGITPADGLYVVGQRFQHRRDSGFVHGARHDAQAVVRHLLTGSTAGASGEHSEEPAA
jgi:putative flavoprotein involved in K+ transport